MKLFMEMNGIGEECALIQPVIPAIHRDIWREAEDDAVRTAFEIIPEANTAWMAGFRLRLRLRRGKRTPGHDG
jgi:hypothetical protein